VSTDDLENFEAELRLQLYREYRDVARMFRYVVETERGVYLANGVETETIETGGRPRVVLELTDAWVWDMYRPHRFVPHVQITTFRDVVVEELAHEDLDVAKRLDLRHEGQPPGEQPGAGDPGSGGPSPGGPGPGGQAPPSEPGGEAP
jgi:hypothetical protein